MSQEQMNDSTFGRLFIIMIIVMTVLTIIIMVLASVAASDVNEKLDAVSEAENSTTISERLAPVGTFNAETVAAAPIVDVTLSGEEAYATCSACHDAGIAGAPQIGIADLWADRIAQGMDKLYENAINGFSGTAGFMPAKGGNAALSDESVKAAVDYMVEQSQ